jgi:hypothetical protein
MKRPLAGLLVFAALGAACSNNETPTTPAAPTPVSPFTETLKGSIASKGIAIRTFTAIQPGTVSVTFNGTEPASAMVLGLGIGIRSASGVDCQFTRTVNTPPGATPQLSIAVDTGTYCAGVYDVGNVGPNGIIVTVTITHP